VTAAEPSISCFIEGDELYAAMLADVGGARRMVRLETYIYAADEIGEAFAAALIERARAGVSVHLRIDALGSLDTMSASLAARLLAGGVQLEWCRRWNWRKPLQFHRRNHRKLLIIDDICFYLGGFNMHRECSLRAFGELRWRDTHVRLSGALVARAIETFDEYDRNIGRRRRWQQLRTDDGYLVPNLGLTRRFLLHRLLRRLFRSARARLWLTTPYFVPPAGIQRALIHAARRGVDVRVLVPRRNDIRLAQWASRSAYARLLAGGVRIFEYLPRMLHAKTAVIDSNWSMVGTANLDFRSLFINDELVLLSDRSGLNQQLEQDFLADLDAAEEISVGTWSRRFGLAWIAELIGWLARRWL
jgi:cardiolipin synthase A/B